MRDWLKQQGIVLSTLVLLGIVGGVGAYLGSQRMGQLEVELRAAKLEAARAASAAVINIEYDAVLQSVIAKMQEYHTIEKFDEREITGLARLILEQVALHREEGLTPSLVMSTMEAESGFDPEAVSSAGALGLMQVMPGTSRVYLKDLGYMEYNQELLFDPLVNTRVGIEHLLFLHRMFTAEGLEDIDDYDISLAAYNWGEAPVRRLLAGLDDPANLKYAMTVRAYMPFYIERGLE